VHGEGASPIVLLWAMTKKHLEVDLRPPVSEANQNHI